MRVISLSSVASSTASSFSVSVVSVMVGSKPMVVSGCTTMPSPLPLPGKKYLVEKGGKANVMLEV